MASISASSRRTPRKAKAGFGVTFRSTVWSSEQIAALLDVAPPTIRTAASVLLYTAQRPDDVVGMEWTTIATRADGSLWLSLTQAKTGKLITVPCHRVLAAILRETPGKRRVGLLLPSPRAGVRWQYRNFSRAWDRTVARADYRLARRLFREGLAKDEIRPRLLRTAGMQRRDLRRTSMVRMAEAGATDAQIAGVARHTIDQTRRILDTYIPRRSEVAAGAIRAWERLDDGHNLQLVPAGVAEGVAQRPIQLQRPIPVGHRTQEKPLFNSALLARPGGLEPPTHSLEGCCSIRLS